MDCLASREPLHRRGRVGARENGDDVHTLSGNVDYRVIDPEKPFRPVIWHCE
jgi:hypothetical protein